MYHMGMDSSILSSLRGPCISACCLLDGTHIVHWKSKLIYSGKLKEMMCCFILGCMFDIYFVCIYNLRWNVDVGWTSTWIHFVNEVMAAISFGKYN